eukprot:scaffold111903_cov18-Tisochrysis_lutea.AAC.2
MKLQNTLVATSQNKEPGSVVKKSSVYFTNLLAVVDCGSQHGDRHQQEEEGVCSTAGLCMHLMVVARTHPQVSVSPSQAATS